MAELIDLIGKRFGKLVVTRYAGKDGHKRHQWLCMCDCGKETTTRGARLKNGYTKSCGCLRIEKATKHGHYLKNKQSKEYQAWNHMIQRCTNQNYQYWEDYGGRGITVCERWEKFPNFLEDMGESPNPEYSIDRIKNNKGYYKENCRWATRKEQGRNKRNNIFVIYNNQKQLIVELAERFHIPYNTLKSRIKRGWPIQKALTAPVGKYGIRHKD